MKKIEYCLLQKSEHSDISLYMEKASSSTCPWHNSLSPLLFGIKSIRSWFEEKKELYFNNKIDYETLNDQINLNSYATAKVCPGIKDLLNNSYLIKTPVDIHLSIHEDNSFYWNVPSKSSSGLNISSHSRDQFVSGDLFKDKLNIKFELPVLLTTNNIPYAFFQPTYHTNADWEVVPGVITGKHTRLQELNVNTLFPIPKSGTEHYMIKAGTVLGYIWLPEKTKMIEAKKQREHLPVYKFTGNGR